MNTLPTGKLPLGLLDNLLSKYTGSSDPRVLVGPRLGEDAAVIDFGETLLVAKTDPITSRWGIGLSVMRPRRSAVKSPSLRACHA